MILKGENRRTRRKTSPSSTLSTKNITQTDLGSNPSPCDDRPATKRLRQGTKLLDSG